MTSITLNVALDGTSVLSAAEPAQLPDALSAASPGARPGVIRIHPDRVLAFGIEDAHPSPPRRPWPTGTERTRRRANLTDPTPRSLGSEPAQMCAGTGSPGLPSGAA